MTPQLQQVLRDLDQLTLSDRWQVVEYLIRQFKGMLGETFAPAASVPTPSAQAILTRTQGSWGQKTREEIDAQIAQQRQQDWGE